MNNDKEIEDMAENNGSMLAPLHAKSKVKRVIGVVSGKGGVGISGSCICSTG